MVQYDTLGLKQRAHDGWVELRAGVLIYFFQRIFDRQRRAAAPAPPREGGHAPGLLPAATPGQPDIRPCGHLPRPLADAL